MTVDINASAHRDVIFPATIAKTYMRPTFIKFPVNWNDSFTGDEMTIHIRQTTSIPTLGPEDVIGFAKKPASMLAEGLTYRAASNKAASSSNGIADLILFSKKAGPVRRQTKFLKNKIVIKLDRSLKYKFEIRPYSTGVFDIKVFIQRYQTSWWNN